MNSTKELKNVTKAQKKTQKVNKKQQLKQQQQPQPADNNISKNVKNAHLSTSSAAPNSKSAKSTATSPPTAPALNHSNNNNIMQTNNNTTHQKPTAAKPPAMLSAPGSTPRTILPGYENAPKFERSNSFSLRGKLSKLINSITGSKENLSRAAEDDAATPYKFTRSRSMILLRRANRRSFIEPQLEQLSEEAEKLSDITLPASPRKNSMEMPELTLSKPAGKAEAVPDAAARTPLRQNSQPLTSTPVHEQYGEREEEVKLRRKPSSISLAAGEGNGVPFNPIHHFQRRRSNTLLASFKNTIVNLTTEKKKEKLNPRWSASLQSLQAIDNMVSYENMSFIDYDKFHGYEKQLERQLSTLSLMEQQQQGDGPPVAIAYADPPPYSSINVVAPPSIAAPAYISANCTVISLPTPQTVVRRRKTTAERKSARSSFNLDTDYEHNLDKPRNVYRDSLDSRKLERLNDFSRNSFILDKHIADWLNLEDGSVGKRRAMNTHQHSAGDVVDATTGAIQVSRPNVMSHSNEKLEICGRSE